MKCPYCKDKILKSQKTKTRVNREGPNKIYHEGCFELMLAELIESVRKNLR